MRRSEISTTGTDAEKTVASIKVPSILAPESCRSCPRFQGLLEKAALEALQNDTSLPIVICDREEPLNPLKRVISTVAYGLGVGCKGLVINLGTADSDTTNPLGLGDLTSWPTDSLPFQGEVTFPTAADLCVAAADSGLLPTAIADL